MNYRAVYAEYQRRFATWDWKSRDFYEDQMRIDWKHAELAVKFASVEMDDSGHRLRRVLVSTGRMQDLSWWEREEDEANARGFVLMAGDCDGSDVFAVQYEDPSDDHREL